MMERLPGARAELPAPLKPTETSALAEKLRGGFRWIAQFRVANLVDPGISFQ
jgi:hypothetical protein